MKTSIRLLLVAEAFLFGFASNSALARTIGRRSGFRSGPVFEGSPWPFVGSNLWDQEGRIFFREALISPVFNM